MMSKPKLKPCPFCGSIAELKRNDDYCHYVECSKCFTFNMQHSTEAEAIEAWNTRQQELDLESLLKESEDENIELRQRISELKKDLSETQEMLDEASKDSSTFAAQVVELEAERAKNTSSAVVWDENCNRVVLPIKWAETQPEYWKELYELTKEELDTLHIINAEAERYRKRLEILAAHDDTDCREFCHVAYEHCDKCLYFDGLDRDKVSGDE
jgi:Lar family restriction alleviation protein